MEKEDLLSHLQKEHELILEILLKMSSSLMREDLEVFSELMKQFDETAGPHFRFEEEAVYPSLVEAYFPGYLTKLYTDHDLAIARFNQLNGLFDRAQPAPEAFYNGIRHVRMIAQYILNCEILPIGKIPLNEQQIKRLTAIYRKSKNENLGLILWSDTRRKRKQLFFN